MTEILSLFMDVIFPGGTDLFLLRHNRIACAMLRDVGYIIIILTEKMTFKNKENKVFVENFLLVVPQLEWGVHSKPIQLKVQGTAAFSRNFDDVKIYSPIGKLICSVKF